jgi:hypothetical protein
LKAGASTIEPQPVADAFGFLQMNIDKGIQANPGSAAVVLGTIEGTTPCASGLRVWDLKPFAGSGKTVTVTADAQGALWVFTGTDSGFEATTSIYLTRFEVHFD